MPLFKKKCKSTEPNNVPLTEEEIISLLHTSSEALHKFEEMYKSDVLSNPELDFQPDNMFDVNAKQAAQMNNVAVSISNDELESIINRIVNELVSKTSLWVYDGNDVCKRISLRSDTECKTSVPVSNDEIKNFPLEMRPQLTGTLMKRDIPSDSYPMLLWCLSEIKKIDEMIALEDFDDNKKTSDESMENLLQKRSALYHQFRWGLDLLDLDPITHEMLGMNPNSMGHWLPSLVSANKNHDFFRIPATVIAKVPMTLLQLTRVGYENLTVTSKAIVNKWAAKAFNLHPDKDYFIKTGTYSSKFDCHVNDAKEIMEIGEYLLYIHFAALQMCSPFAKPRIYGVSTTNEWVVREFIQDKEHAPVIYKGLPLHTEYRIFIDCDTKSVLGIMPYWEPETMKKRFDEKRDNHDVHDGIVYRTYEDTLMAKYNANKELVKRKVQELLPDLALNGQWSLDVMQNGDDFWLIDMALAELSFGYDKFVPEKDRRPSEENWIPKIE